MTEDQSSPTTSESLTATPPTKNGNKLLQEGLGGPAEPNASFPITATFELAVSGVVPTAMLEKNEETKEAEAGENWI